MEQVNHPAHYGGDNTYEAIKVIEAWGLNFRLGNCVKYIARAGKKGNRLLDLQKALWYLQREISKAKEKVDGEVSAAASVLDRVDDSAHAGVGELPS